MQYYANEIIDRIRTVLGALTDPTLKVYQRGNLSFMPPPADLSSWVPACIIQANAMTRGDESFEGNAIQWQTYDYTIFFLREWAAGENIEDEKIDETEKIAKALLNDRMEFSNKVPLTNGRVKQTDVTAIRYNTSATDPVLAIILEQALDITLSEIDFQALVVTEIA